MPDKCKNLFELSMKGLTQEELQDNARKGKYKDIGFNEEFDDKEIDFLKTKRTVKDFDIGLKVPDKLMPKRIIGGVLLVNTYYEMR